MNLRDDKVIAPVQAAIAAAVYLIGLAVAGWMVGGRPAGWYEGKFLLMPAQLLAFVCACVASVGLFRQRLWSVQRSSPAMASRRSRAAVIIGTLLIVIALLAASFSTMGVAVIHEIASWRRALWQAAG